MIVPVPEDPTVYRTATGIVYNATVTELISENRVCPVLTNKFCLLVRSHYVQTVLFSHNKFWTAHNTLDILQNQSIVRYHTSILYGLFVRSHCVTMGSFSLYIFGKIAQNRCSQVLAVLTY
eukprot:COSAG02_NODE_9284_length_2266_cov_46.566682_3_plen_121_part_00